MTDPVASGLRRAAIDACGGIEWSDHASELLGRLGILGLMTRSGAEMSAREDVAASLLKNRMRANVLLEAASEVTGALDREGIQHFFAKGIVLVGTVYHRGERSLADIDLFVPYGSRESALAVLEVLGYRAVPDQDQAGPAELRSALALSKDGTAELDMMLVDLHWALNPVRRLLPRGDRAIPQRVWSQLIDSGDLPAPRPAHHAALLVHHLVYTDLLHIRSLIDLAYVYQTLAHEHIVEFLDTCAELDVLRVARSLVAMLVRDFGLSDSSGSGMGRPRALSDGCAALLRLSEWLRLVAELPDREFYEITSSRIRTRAKLVDGAFAWASLLADVVVPPPTFLRWRWPESRTVPGAYGKHISQLARKVVGR